MESAPNKFTSRTRNRRPLKFNSPQNELPIGIHFLSSPTIPNFKIIHDGITIPTPAVKLMTEKLVEIFSQCNTEYQYDKRLNPRRVLTKPSKPFYNGGHDNEKHDYILYVNDVLGNEEGRKYVILDLLGQGTFGQVVKCQNVKSKELVAVKVIKNQPAFFNQSMMEVTVLEMINQRYDKDNRHHIIRMRDTFVFRQHLCIVVELLSLNLYDLIKQNQYRGFSLSLCRIFLAQILDALKILKEARIIHCDLKPENILLRNLESPSIKVIDFGSACHEHQTLYTYIQSRFYRSPEVLLGLPYSSSIDMWSLGCIAAELFLGLPIFPGASNYDQVSRIVQTLGVPPPHMLEVGKETQTYFERVKGVEDGRANHYKLKSRDRYSLDMGKIEPPPKQYFSSTNLDEIIMNYPIRPKDISPKDRELEMSNRRCFLDFIKGLLNLNPIERWSPLQASQHPFITGKSFTGPFIPPASVLSTPVQMNPNLTPRVKTGNTKQRPRANTLGSLSLQDVPQQLQRIAASRDQNAQVVGHPERFDLIPENISENDGSSQPILPFELTSLTSADISVPTSSIASTSGHSERINAYASNRRVSQPMLQPGGIRCAIPNDYNNNQPVIPSSMPNTVWYGPEPTFGMSPDNSSYKSSNRTHYTRRGSFQMEGKIPTNNNNNNSLSPHHSPDKPRRSSTGNLILSSSPLKGEDEEKLRPGRRDRASSSSSMMDVLNEQTESETEYNTGNR